jgi:hypothetical protein
MDAVASLIQSRVESLAMALPTVRQSWPELAVLSRQKY